MTMALGLANACMTQLFDTVGQPSKYSVVCVRHSLLHQLSANFSETRKKAVAMLGVIVCNRSNCCILSRFGKASKAHKIHYQRYLDDYLAIAESLLKFSGKQPPASQLSQLSPWVATQIAT